ncbi:TPA: hypothetical protein ACF24J_004427 [Escherichia coli]|uniref:hypothetical protein n=1 Tax=Escherichia coli TaxID=562 RepID=UPI0021D68BD9|nr:hypothetical protein [Escherichia coli]MCU7735536.1 hypothetical protein [Escherichia coli]
MENSSCAERKSYLPERILYASSPVRSLRSVTWLWRALIHKVQLCTGRNRQQWHLFAILADELFGSFFDAMNVFECPFGNSGLPRHMHDPDKSGTA